MLVHPQFDPVALSIGPIALRWYGLMYLLAFGQFLLLGRWLIARRGVYYPYSHWQKQHLEDFLFYGMVGVIVGGRLGEVLFYHPGYYFANPLQILAIWKGGMSFHGGFLGVLAALTLWARKRGLHWFAVSDFIAPLAPLGLACGRIGNFINGELWGRVANPNLPWAMIFPQAGDQLARHPSQLYHVALEGLLLFVVLWFFSRRPQPPAATSGLFLLGYGLCRFATEFFREPDSGIFGFSYAISMGQWLSLPMIIIGSLLLWLAYSHNKTIHLDGNS